MKVKYYGYDNTVGHKDGSYFEAEVDSDKPATSKEYTAYWLTDINGNRAPESVYRELEKPSN